METRIVLGYTPVYADGTTGTLPWRDFGTFLAELTRWITRQERGEDTTTAICGYKVLYDDEVEPGSFLAVARLVGPP